MHPFFLLEMLVAMRKLDVERTGDDSSFLKKKFTFESLRNMFPACEIKRPGSDRYVSVLQ